ncbi:sulfotransferase family 2 domain-containing protein [Marivita hallyeonensis]|uniref:Sulfotransferase family protein n=1 Tax=Marivita hallyeonensis TaxID=996342 RepID=A0A1M5NM70_9RHOB|nr:sulfotransferase family 2 domain-containing protein [Marivita hallyeonensis]SHG90043.1 Sulfotransferase family protein [Marivita hallyeonensis]
MSFLKTAHDRLRRRQTWRYYHFEDPPSTPRFKRFPLKQAMIADPVKVIYMPIAKNACSSLKTLMAKLGGLTEQRPGEDIHRLLDTETTDLLFLHRSEKDIMERLFDPLWMRFVVLRHPVDRLVSVYVEKFVKNRMVKEAGITIDPVMLRSLGVWDLTAADYERGITFRAFANDILRENPARLDPHWRPQSLQLKAIPFTHVYTTEHLAVLKSDLDVHVGQRIDLPHKNRARYASSDTARDCVADVLPSDLDDAQTLSPDAFLDDDLRQRLSVHFAQDILLYDLASRHLEQSQSGRITDALEN